MTPFKSKCRPPIRDYRPAAALLLKNSWISPIRQTPNIVAVQQSRESPETIDLTVIIKFEFLAEFRCRWVE